MQFQNGTVKVRRGYQTVGYMHSAVVGGTCYDWYARIDGQTMPQPLTLSQHTLQYSSSLNAWWSDDPDYPNWDAQDWEDNFAQYLDGLHGSGNWHREKMYTATESSW
jgi:hypothetical protein